MTKNTLVFIDQFKGEVQPSSWEAMGVAHTLAGDGGQVSALVIGHQVDDLAQAAFHYGADEVFLADDPALADYRPEPWGDVTAQVARDANPDVILFPTTTRGRELAGLASVDLETGVLVDVLDLQVEGDGLTATRSIYAGKLFSEVSCSASPQLVTLRGRAFPTPEPDPSLGGDPTHISLELSPDLTTTVTGYEEKGGGVSLKDAAVIVSGGRGASNNPNLSPPADLSEEEQEVWKAEQGFQLVNDLADVLGGAVGASRAAVDANYIAYEHQVGQTGKVVSPDLYIACGVSGAIQHLAGMRTSKVIVAINKDENAPIFKLARFGVVGDLFEVLPPLTEGLKAALG